MFISLICFNTNVFADDATCVYKIGASITYTVHLNEGESPKVTLANVTQGLGISATDNDFVNVNFQDSTNKTWRCPSEIYYINVPSGASVTYKSFSTTKTDSRKYALSLDNSYSKDGGALTPTEDEMFYCKYGSLQMSVNKTKKTISGSSMNCQNVNFDFKYDDIIDNKGGCPYKVYVKIGTNTQSNQTYCTYYLTPQTGATDAILLNGDEPVIDGGGNTVTSPEKDDTDDKKTVTYCPLGPDVTKDLAGALKIFKILAPILVIGLSIFDAIKASVMGDVESDMKKVAKRFIKRLCFAAILFFLPVLVDQLMQMMNVWDSHGRCDLNNPVDNFSEGKAQEEKKVCIKKGAGYRWDDVNDKCINFYSAADCKLYDSNADQCRANGCQYIAASGCSPQEKDSNSPEHGGGGSRR